MAYRTFDPLEKIQNGRAPSFFEISRKNLVGLERLAGHTSLPILVAKSTSGSKRQAVKVLQKVNILTYLRIARKRFCRSGRLGQVDPFRHPLTQKTRSRIFRAHRDPILAPPPRQPEIFLAPPCGKSIYRSVRPSEPPREGTWTHLV